MQLSPHQTEPRSRNGQQVHPILSTARCLIDGSLPGIFTTLDESGYPTSRWMATLALDRFPRIHTVTGPASRKLQQIAANPRVSWMFTHEDMSLVLNLFGTAHVVGDMDVIQHVWKTIHDKSHAYFLKKFGGSEGCAVIETIIDRIECTLPERNQTFDLAIAEFQET